MKRIFTNVLAILTLCLPLTCLASLSSVAFFYGAHPPLDQLRAFDVVVVSADAKVNPLSYNSPQSELFAYVSVGEVNPHSFYQSQINKKWILGKNIAWQSQVIDQTQAAWQTFFLEKIITPLWEKGYRGFFLDTLDSYMLYTQGSSAQAQINALINLIHALKTKYPEAKLILNRGFELVPMLQDSIYAVAVESLFASWNQEKQKYVTVTKEDREYLLTKLLPIQKKGIPIIVIDYLPHANRQEAWQVAQKISHLGMIPWVTDGQLQTLGVGSIMPLPRKIFVIYSRDEKSTIFDPAPFVLTDSLLAYLGYISEYHDVKKPLPENFSVDNYAGILVWAEQSRNNNKNQQMLHAWLVKRLSQHIPILFINDFGFPATPQALKPFGLILSDMGDVPKTVHIAQQDAMIGYEIKPFFNRFQFIALKALNSKILLQLVDEHQHKEDAVAITPWGGYALDPFTISQMPDATNFWVLNPLKWLPLALHLPTIPAPDVTTENGRRLMMVHIDGDGFVNQAEWNGGQLAAIELQNLILNLYRIPTTVSVITGEIAANGLYPKFSAQLVKIAKDIFSLPWVEIASHTFSHPFDWIKIEKYPQSGRYNLPIPHYQYNAQDEIMGSANYINRNLAPPDKVCKILLWSGSANPDEKTLALTYQAQLPNLNGVYTVISNLKPSITNIGPNNRTQNTYVQVLAPVANEEEFTNGWRGPYYGFERVIETFKLTDKPHRFKPIDIYYHFYSITKLASVKALRKVYNWSLSQSVRNIFLSEYFAKVWDFNKASIARVSDGWQITTTGNLRELRVPTNLGYPDLIRSENIIGYSAFNDSYYVHLGPAAKSLLYFTKRATSLPYLVETNGSVSQFQRNKDGFTMHLQGYLPLQWTFANMTNCTVKQAKKMLSGNRLSQGNVSFALSTKDSDELYVTCR